MVFGALGYFWLQRTQVEMDLQEVTLERVTKNNAKFVMILLRPIYHETKNIEALGKKLVESHSASRRQEMTRTVRRDQRQQ